MSIPLRAPNETLLQILKLADNFKTATSLCSTCHLFRSIWEEHSVSICHSILKRTIPCYTQAFEYIRAQEAGGTNCKMQTEDRKMDGWAMEDREMEDRDMEDREMKDREMEDRVPLVIKITIRFRKNAGQADKALLFYEAQMVIHISYGSADPSRLTQAQVQRFLKAWYRIHTLLSLPAEFGCCDMWTSLNLLEFDQMLDVMCWSIHHCSEEHKVELEIILSSSDDDFILELDPSPKPKPKPRRHQNVEPSIAAERWHDLMKYLCFLYKKLPNKGRSSIQYFNRLEYFWQFVAHEYYFENEDLGEGTCLMDVLPGNRG